jgi:Na+-transporting methylmalonyl-CoA/oxaloacetate decarboxylase gamma subunit
MFIGLGLKYLMCSQLIRIMQAIAEIIVNHHFLIIDNPMMGSRKIGNKIKGIKVVIKAIIHSLSQKISLRMK